MAKSNKKKAVKAGAVVVLHGKPVVRNSDYDAILDQIDAVRVEVFHVAHETIIKGKLEMGEIIATQKLFGITELVQSISKDLKINERDLWYCFKFYENYKTISKLPEFESKAISWNKIKKLLSAGDKARDLCADGHKHTETIVVCVDCGKKIKDE